MAMHAVRVTPACERRLEEGPCRCAVWYHLHDMRTIIDPDPILRELPRLRATQGEAPGSPACRRIGGARHDPLHTALIAREGQGTRRPRQ